MYIYIYIYIHTKKIPQTPILDGEYPAGPPKRILTSVLENRKKTL